MAARLGCRLALSSSWRCSHRPLAFSLPRLFSSSRTCVASAPKPFSELPGVKGWPVLGDTTLLSQNEFGKTVEEIHLIQLSNKYTGTFKIKILGSWTIMVQTPDAVEAVFRAEGKYPSRGAEPNMTYIYSSQNMPAPMAFAIDEEWKRLRSLASKQIAPRRVRNFVDPMCDLVDDFISHLEGIMDDQGNIADIPPEVSKWTFQSVSYFVYGEKINTYSKTDPLQKEFIEAGSDFVQSVAQIASAPPFYRIFPTKPYRRFLKIVNRMKKAAMVDAGSEILKSKMERIKESEHSKLDEEEAVGLLDQWLAEKKFTEEEALSLSYDLLSAGIDTTSNSSSYLLYELARHPEIQECLVQEIDMVVGDKEYPSWEDIQNMPLLRNCVKEIMRLYTVIPFQARVLEEETVVDGYTIPAGISAMINMYKISKNEDIFENPTSFNPDRWDRSTSSNSHPFSSLPFGFGPRSCYGRRLAELEMFLLVIKLLPRYELSTTVRELKMKYATVCTPSVPIHLKLSKRTMVQ